jgi:hypothetical protein
MNTQHAFDLRSIKRQLRDARGRVEFRHHATRPSAWPPLNRRPRNYIGLLISCDVCSCFPSAVAFQGPSYLQSEACFQQNLGAGREVGTWKSQRFS